VAGFFFEELKICTFYTYTNWDVQHQTYFANNKQRLSPPATLSFITVTFQWALPIF
jgi:hypothetical protein